jgi:fermentation-respiration switch protein FrsA (DUF1100 family)
VKVYLGFCLIVYLAQSWFAFPGTMEQGKPATQIHCPGDVEKIQLALTDGTPITAIFGRARRPDHSLYEPSDHRPTILYFYGNASCVAYSEGEFDHFRAMGCNVLIPDLAGYGQSGGKASESNFYATADAAWNYLQHRPNLDGKKIIVVGWSMGAAIAVDLASRKPVAGLATFNAFTDLGAMARRLLPYVPTSLLLSYRFDNLAKISQIHCPMLICNGKLDTLVPPAMSDELTAHAGGPVMRVVIPTADHNGIFDADPEMVWGVVSRFVGKFE